MKRFMTHLFILVVILTLLVAIPAIAADKLYFISRQHDQITWYDWVTHQSGKPTKVLPNPRFVVQGQEPDIAFVLSRGKLRGDTPIGPSGISIVDTRLKKEVGTVEIGWGLNDFYRSPDKSKLFIVTGAVGLKPEPETQVGMFVFDLNSRQVEKKLPLNYNPVASALSPDGKTLALLTAGLPDADPAKAAPPLLQVYDLEQEALIAEAPLELNPAEVAFTPDGARLFILTAGYPNILGESYPQIKSDSPVWGSVSVWDVASRATLWTQGVGYAANQMSLSADGTTAYLFSVLDKKLAVVSVAVPGGIRTYYPERPIAVIPDPQARILYLVSDKSVEILDVKTWSVANSIPHEEKWEMLDIGFLPDGRGYVLEKDNRRISFYDPVSNNATSISLIIKKAKSSLLPSGLTMNSDGYAQRQAVQVAGNKMYILPYKSLSVRLLDLGVMQFAKEIEVSTPGMFKMQVYALPEALFLTPSGKEVLAVAAYDTLLTAPIDVEADEVGKILKQKIKIEGNQSVAGMLLGTGEKVLYSGPLFDPEHNVVYTVISQNMFFMDYTTGKGGQVHLGKGEWDAQFSEKVTWTVQKKSWRERVFR